MTDPDRAAMLFPSMPSRVHVAHATAPAGVAFASALSTLKVKAVKSKAKAHKALAGSVAA